MTSEAMPCRRTSHHGGLGSAGVAGIAVGTSMLDIRFLSCSQLLGMVSDRG
jgi:hypothetical protein